MMSVVLLLVAVSGVWAEPPGQFTRGAVIRFPAEDGAAHNQQTGGYNGVQGLQYYSTVPASAGQTLMQLYQQNNHHGQSSAGHILVPVQAGHQDLYGASSTVIGHPSQVLNQGPQQPQHHLHQDTASIHSPSFGPAPHPSSLSTPSPIIAYGSQTASPIIYSSHAYPPTNSASGPVQALSPAAFLAAQMSSIHNSPPQHLHNAPPSHPHHNRDLTYGSISPRDIIRRPTYKVSYPPMKGGPYSYQKPHSLPSYHPRKPMYSVMPRPPHYAQKYKHKSPYQPIAAPSSVIPSIYAPAHGMRSTHAHAHTHTHPWTQGYGGGGMTKVIYHSKPAESAYSTITKEMMLRENTETESQGQGQDLYQYGPQVDSYNPAVGFNQHHRSATVESPKHHDKPRPGESTDMDTAPSDHVVEYQPRDTHKTTRPSAAAYHQPDVTSSSAMEKPRQQHDKMAEQTGRHTPTASSSSSSSWVPINAPEGAVPARSYDIRPPNLSRSDTQPTYMRPGGVSSVPLVGRPETPEVKFPRRQDMTERRVGGVSSEEVVSAVVLVKQK